MSDDHGHGHGDPNLAHHWDTMDQQVHAGKFGMWLFLSTEVLLFAGLFCAYCVYRGLHPEVFAEASKVLDWKLGALNTVILLISSFTMAMGVRAAQLGNRSQTSLMLVLTLCGAAGFMIVKGVEYTAKFEHGTIWAGHPGSVTGGYNYVPQTDREFAFPEDAAAAPAEGQEAHSDSKVAALLTASAEPSGIAVPAGAGVGLVPNRAAAPPPEGLAHGDHPRVTTAPKIQNMHIFFGIYFVMTGTHGLHVIIGGIAIVWVLIRNMRGDFTPKYNLPVDLVGLYWHLVDLIWIFLFPLLYLIHAEH
ncbi:MAG: cytochrome c oxidase subunit 3 family protein [Planctomycetota bacterium]